MRRVLFFLLLPTFVFVTNQRVISTEKDIQLTPKQEYEVTATSYGTYYTTIPRNPNLYKETYVFSDSSLSKVAGVVKPNTPLKIIQLYVNEDKLPIFKLSNGNFISADKRIIFEDIILSKEEKVATMWLAADATVYPSVPINGVAPKKEKLSVYSRVTIKEIAQTPISSYAFVEGKGWIAASLLVENDNRMQKVQQLLNQKYNQENLSIYVKQLGTDEVAGIHQDKIMYSASIAKLPVLYYSQKLLDKGTYTLNQTLKYIPEVNDYKGAYDPEGSGSISKTPDGKDYSIEDLMNRDAKESDNVANNILGYYLTKQANQEYQKEISGIVGKNWDPENRDASAEMAGKMMEKIYYQNGFVLNTLSETKFDDQRISKDISVKVAHKIGDAYDFKHDVAVVYTESPFILSIFTNNSSYDTITQIANDVYGVLK